MKSLWSILQSARPGWPLLDAMGRPGVIDWGGPGDADGSRQITADPRKVAPEYREALADAASNPATLLEVWSTAMLIHQGPRVYRPALQTCLALEQINIPIGVADYAQPYPAFTVEFPPEYAILRPAEGMGPAQIATVCWWPQESVVLSISFANGQAITGACHASERHTLDDWTSQGDYGEDYNPNDPVTAGEAKVVAALRRVALNALLLLVDRGCLRLGPDDPSYAARLDRYVEVAKKRGKAAIAEAELNRRIYPTRYDLEDAAPIARSERIATGASGHSVRPHWRRGHWRLQRVGVGLTETRRILIAPVLVRADLA